MREIYKDIKWYEWLYLVSDLGNIKSLNYNKTKKECNLCFWYNQKWYPFVWLSKEWKRKTYRVNRLVFLTFNNLPLVYTWNNLVCHKDDDIKNNNLNNLFLWTHKDNIQDCIIKWRYSYNWYEIRWEKSSSSKLKEYEVREIKKLLKENELTQTDIANKYKIGDNSISRIKLLKTWKHIL